MILYLIRHGRQNSPLCNLDVPLSNAGRRQAELLGKRMAGYPVDALYTSNLVRAEETGRIAFRERGSLVEDIRIREGLSEMDFGSLTGVEDSVLKEYYREYYDRQVRLFREESHGRGKTSPELLEHYVGEFFVPPGEMGYPQGENGIMVLSRLMPVVREWINGPHEHIAVVTHGGVIRMLLCALFGGDLAKRLMFGTSLENCSITQLHYDEGVGGFFLDRFNDYAHIEGEPELMRSRYVGPNGGR